MADKIKPALTSADWAHYRAHPEQVATSVSRMADDCPCGSQGDDDDELPDDFSHPYWHGCAALALHGQPFGFTREDVWSLGSIADHVEHYKLCEDDVASLRSLADRIAALLPPKDGG